jgi:hypothetical protein
MTTLLLAAALAASPDLPSHDTLLLAAPARLDPGAARVGVQGGGNPATSLVGAFGLWSVGGSFAAQVGADNQDGKVTPTAGLRWWALSQEEAGVDLAALARFKSSGFRADGSEVELATSLGRSFGSLSLAVNGVAGKGFGEGSAIDVEGGAAARLALGRGWVGLEGRYRQEVAAREAAPEPPGRRFDLVAGPSAGLALRFVRLEGLVGWSMPLGTAPAGAAGLAMLSVDL